MTDFIGIDVAGLDELQKILARLPDELRGQIVDDVGEYIHNVLRLYPPYKYVSRRAAYGQTFFSDRQRRWFFAALRDGQLEIPYKRTQALSRGWRKLGQGTNLMIVNEAAHAGYVMGDGTQSRHAAAIGWKTTAQIVEERQDRIIEIAQAGAKKAIKRLGG